MGPDQELERMMRARVVPQMRSHLAERIVEAAMREQRSGKGAPEAWFIAFQEAFILPRPAYVMAALFVIALATGLSFDVTSFTGLDSVSNDYVYTAETVTEGDWL